MYNPYKVSKRSLCGGLFMAHTIGTTELRQKLTDVLQDVREGGETYVIQTFGRPQAAIVNLKEFQRFRGFLEERDRFFEWMEGTAARNAERNAGLSEEEVLTLIEQARHNATA
jgi:prevent-host-death family protein